jgi:hypothetical protein
MIWPIPSFRSKKNTHPTRQPTRKKSYAPSSKSSRFSASLNVEPLEDRCCPSATVTPSGGNLTITGDNTSNTVLVQAVANNSVNVTVNGSPASGNPYALTGNLTINMGSANDSVTLDLNGFSLHGSVSISSGASLANGGDTITIEDTSAAGTGNIGGSLSITTGKTSGTGNDQVIFTGVAGFNVDGKTTITGDAASSTSVMVDNGANPAFIVFDSLVTITNADNVTIGTGTNIGPEFHGGLTVNNSAESPSIANVFTMSFSSYIVGDLQYQGSAGNDAITVGGVITHDVDINAGDGTNSYIDKGSEIAHDLNYTGGSGNDDFELRGIQLGPNNDNDVLATYVHHDVNINMGGGNNTYYLQSGDGVTSFGYLIGHNLNITDNAGNNTVGTIGGNAVNGPYNPGSSFPNTSNLATSGGYTSRILGTVSINFNGDPGNNQVTFDGGSSSVSTGKVFTSNANVHYTGGSGADNVEVDGTNTCAFNVNLGGGSDTFTYGKGASVASANLDGGGDTGGAFDTYNGGGNTITWPQTLKNFEVINP